MDKPIREALKACLERGSAPKTEDQLSSSLSVLEETLLLRSIAADVKRIADVLTEWNRRGVPADRL